MKKTKILKSPLRYPGSKSSLVPYISNLLREQCLENGSIIEPYAGSAIVSLELLNQGVVSNAILIERDPLVYAFWASVFEDPDTLMEEVYKMPVTLETWQSLKTFKEKDILERENIVKVGAAGLFFNRTSFSGILKAGPLGGQEQKSKYLIDCRFNKERIISQIEDISKLKNKVTVIFDDAVDYLKKNKKDIEKENSFLYLDPPYYEKGPQLYRFWYNLNSHKALANFIKDCTNPWLVSYDNHEVIRNLYKNIGGMKEIFFDYGITSGSRIGKELLISNLEIPPFCQSLFENNLA